MIARVNGDQEIDAVFRDVRAGLRPVQEREVLDANQAAVEALSKGDHKAYAEVCCAFLVSSFFCALKKRSTHATGGW